MKQANINFYHLKYYVIIGLIFYNITITAQTAGTLDNTFGNGGVAITDIGGFSDYGRAVAIQSDEKIISAGYIYNGNDYDFALIRYNTDGNLDTGFGNNGIVITNIDSLDDEIRDIIIQTDGKIIAVGTSYVGSYKDIALIRYNTNGSIDTNFGTNGIVLTDIGGTYDYGNSIALQDDNKIIVAGSAFIGSYCDFIVVRYNTDGTLDNTFGTNGIVITAIGSTHDNASHVAIQQNGKIVVAGSFENPNPFMDLAVARYNTDGTLDNTFGVNGIATPDSADNIGSIFVNIQTDNKLFIVGYINGADYVFVKLNPDGTLDNSYGTNGIITTDFTSANITLIRDVAFQSDDKIIIVGYHWNGTNRDFVITRHNLDGSIDSTFGTNGIAITDIANDSEDAYAVVIQNDDKIVVVGDTYDGSDFDFIIARYQGINTGIQEYESNFKCNIYPNPTIGKITVQAEKVLGIEVLDITGKTIIKHSRENGNPEKWMPNQAGHDINLGSQPKGIYIIKVTTDKQTITRKLINQ